MRILIVTQYFWPETFRINEIVLFLEEKGYSVDVLTGDPNYPSGKIFKEYKENKKKFSKYSKSNIYRVPIFPRGSASPIRLFFNYLSYVLSAIFIGFFKLRNRRYDVVFTFATSPISVAIPSLFFCWIKKSKHILWVLDLWPDILEELNIVKNRFVRNKLHQTINYIYRKSDIILAQSKGFVNTIRSRVENKEKVHLFYSWYEQLKPHVDYFEPNNVKKKFNIVFTGNVGEAQNFDNIIKVAESLKNEEDLQWIVVGTGRKLEDIKVKIKQKKINNFLLVGHKPIEAMSHYHKIADVLLVSLSSGNFLSSTIPGKISTYMKSNKFILGFISGDSASLIKESQSGIVVHPDDPQLLAKTILELKSSPEKLKRFNIDNSKDSYVEKYFAKKNILQKLQELLMNIECNLLEFKIIKTVKEVPFNVNFSLSGLNLAFLGYFIQKKIAITKNVYLWPDGIFFNRFFYKKLTKIAGRDLISGLSIPQNIHRIYIFGNLDEESRLYIKNLYKKDTIHINLPYGDVNKMFHKYCNYKFLETDIIFITLPTPKQEEFAQLIMGNNRFYKILCIGGAISMASGLERPVPVFLDKLNLEFLWRLKTDTRRRIKRLFVSGFYYFIGELFGKFSNIKRKKILNEK